MATATQVNVLSNIAKMRDEQSRVDPIEAAVEEGTKKHFKAMRETGVQRGDTLEQMERIYQKLVDNQWLLAHGDMTWLYLKLNEAIVENDRLLAKCEELAKITAVHAMKSHMHNSPTAFNARRNY